MKGKRGKWFNSVQCFRTITFVLFIAVFFLSCRQDPTKRNQELIIGDWAPWFDGYIPTNEIGYQFLADNLCINKTGYYSYFYPNGIRIDHAGEIYNDSTWFCYPYLTDVYPLPYD